METSPPRLAISRTKVPETNWYWSLGVRKTVSTSGMSWRFMPAIWNSYSKSLTARRPRTTTLPPCSTTKSRSRPRNAITSTFGYLRGELGGDVEPLGDREHRALVVAGRDGDEQALEQPAGAAHQVLVAERHRIEGAGVDGGQSGRGRHVGLHAARRRQAVRPPLALDAAQCSRAPQPGAALRISSKWTAPARPARHGSSPAARHRQRIARRGSFGVDEAAGDDDPRRGDERRRQQRRVERRVEEDERRSEPAGARAIHWSASARSIRTALGAQALPGRRQAGDQHRIALEQDDLGRAARRRLEAERARSGEGVDAAPAGERPGRAS